MPQQPDTHCSMTPTPLQLPPWPLTTRLQSKTLKPVAPHCSPRLWLCTLRPRLAKTTRPTAAPTTTATILTILHLKNLMAVATNSSSSRRQRSCEVAPTHLCRLREKAVRGWASAGQVISKVSKAARLRALLATSLGACPVGLPCSLMGSPANWTDVGVSRPFDRQEEDGHLKSV